MSAELQGADSEELKTAWNGIGAGTPDLYGEAYRRLRQREVKRWAEVVKSSGAKME